MLRVGLFDVRKKYRCLEVHMSRRFVELVVGARRFVTRGPGRLSGVPVRRTARRGVGEGLTQFSFRLALVIDLAYVGIGALGGAAIGRAAAPSSTAPLPHCDGGRSSSPTPPGGGPTGLPAMADTLPFMRR